MLRIDLVAVDPIAAVVVRRTGLEVGIVGSALVVVRNSVEGLVGTVVADRKALAGISTRSDVCQVVAL